MKAAVDLTIIKTEKVDIELFPSPGEPSPLPVFPQPLAGKPSASLLPLFFPARVVRGEDLLGEGVIWGGEGTTNCNRQVAAERHRPGSPQGLYRPAQL